MKKAVKARAKPVSAPPKDLPLSIPRRTLEDLRGNLGIYSPRKLLRGPLFLWLAGMLLVFHPLFISAFDTLVGDTGDSQLVECILEHHYLNLTRNEYPGSYASGPFFFPATRNNMALSELLIGAVPLYFLPRVLFGADYGFQIFLMLVCSLNFFCFYWVLRRWAVPAWPAAVAAFVLSFGVFRGPHIPHSHLLLQYPSILSFHFFLRFLLEPSTRLFTLSVAFTCLQTLTSVYLGWFTLLSFTVIFVFGVGLGAVKLKSLAAFVRFRGFQAAGIAALMGYPCLWLLRPYLLLTAERGGRSYEEVESTLSSAADWLYPFVDSFWWHVRLMWGDKLAHMPEGSLFLGIVPAGAALVSLVLVFRRIRRLPPPAALAGAVICSGLALAALATRWPIAYQPWEFVFRYFPAASAIRSPGRIVVMVSMCLLFGSCVVLSQALRSTPRRRVLAVLAPVLAFGVIENSYRFVYSRSRSYFNAEATEILDFISSPEVTAAYIYPRRQEGPYISDINAMLIAQRANKPVVNGYSGADPAGYDRIALKQPKRLFAWLADEPLSSVLVVVPQEATAALTPELTELGAPVTRKGAHYTTFRLNAGSRDFDAGITLLDPPPVTVKTGETVVMNVLLHNRSNFAWQSSGLNPVHLSYQLFQTERSLVPMHGFRSLLPTVLFPGDFNVTRLVLRAPPQPGEYRVVPALVEEGRAWYLPRNPADSKPFEITVK
jgi:hypothetical protein